MNKIPYLLVMIYPIIGYIFDEKFRKTNKYDTVSFKKIFNVNYCFFIFLTLAVLRGNGNGDYYKYLSRVKLIDSVDKIFFIRGFPFEIGYRVIAFINNILGVTPQFTVAIMNLISLFNIKYIIDKYSKNAWLSWFLYFPFLLLFDMHHTRNGVAMSFVLLFAITLLIEKNGIKSLLFAICAICFHKSAIFPILILSIYYLIEYTSLFKRRGKKEYLLVLTLFFSIGSLLSPTRVSTYLVKMFPSSNIFFKLQSYLLNEKWSYPFRFYDPRVLMIILLVILGIYLIQSNRKLINIYFDIIVISLCVIFLLSESTILSIRFYNYFYVIYILFVPELFDLNFFKKPSGERIKKTIIYGHLIYFLALIYIQIPYEYIFSLIL